MCAMKIMHRPSYRKRVGKFAGIDVKHAESVISFSASPDCYNFDMSSGALRGGYGISSHVNVPAEATRYWVYRYYSEEENGYVDQYLFQDRYGMIRYYDSAKDRIRYMSGFAYTPAEAINYRLNSKDVLLISCEGRHLVTWDGDKVVEHSDAPFISSMALHYERLFVITPTEPTRVYFSDDLDPTDWTIGSGAGGFIEMPDERGELKKVVSFANYLYIFREHGISRVSAAGSQSEFTVTDLFVSAGRIYPKSIVKCGGVIMFAASDGIYRFDGYECRRVLGEVSGLITGEPSAAAYYNGRYYLACDMSFAGDPVGCETGEHEHNGLMVYDVATGEYSVTRGLDISYMTVGCYNGEDFLMACDGGVGGVITRCGSRFGTPLHKHWQSPMTDFGAPDRIKAVREVYVTTDAACSIGVAGKKTRVKTVPPGGRCLRFNACERMLRLTVDTDEADCNIDPPTLIYSSY